MPPIQGDGLERNIMYFGQSDGHLHLVDYLFSDGGLSGFDIFEVERDYSLWFVRYHVNLNVIAAQFFSLICRRFGEKSVLVLYIHCKDMASEAASKAISYQLDDDEHTCKTLCDLSIDDELLSEGKGVASLVHQYIEHPFRDHL